MTKKQISFIRDLIEAEIEAAKDPSLLWSHRGVEVGPRTVCRYDFRTVNPLIEAELVYIEQSEGGGQRRAFFKVNK